MRVKSNYFIILFILVCLKLSGQEIVVGEDNSDCNGLNLTLKLDLPKKSGESYCYKDLNKQIGDLHFFTTCNNVTIEEAVKVAKYLGGYLVTSNTKELNDRNHNLYPNGHWIGYIQQPDSTDYVPSDPNSAFYWMSGAPRKEEFWRPGEPDNREPEHEGYSVMQDCDPGHPGLWCDAEPPVRAVGLIESIYDSPPGSKEVEKIVWSTGENGDSIRLINSKLDDISLVITYTDGTELMVSKNLDSFKKRIPKTNNTTIFDNQEGEEIVLTSVNSGEDFSFDWNPKTGLDSYNKPSVLHKFNDEIEYILTVSSKDGCTANEKFLLKKKQEEDAPGELIVENNSTCTDPDLRVKLVFKGKTEEDVCFYPLYQSKKLNYFTTCGPVLFDSAVKVANYLGGNLATANTQELNTLTHKLFPNPHWIGYLQQPDSSDYNDPPDASSGFYWMSGAKRNLTFWRPTEPNNREDINPGRTVVQDCDPNYPGLWCDAEPSKEFVGLIETFYASPPTIPKIKSYLWSTGESSAEINLRDTSIKEISVLVTFENGLSQTFSKNVAKLWYDMPKEYNTLIKDLKLNEEVVLRAQNVGNYQYEWLPNTGLDNYYKKEVNHLFKKDILYELKVTSKDNCFSYEKFDLKGIEINESNEEILVPGIFSPNYDRINDFYFIESLDFIEDFSVVIFTREGKVIFESTDQNFRWDGSFNGVLQPSGLYGIRFKYKFDGQVKEFTRPLVIQR